MILQVCRPGPKISALKQPPLWVWRATWLPLGLSIFFFCLALLMLYVVLGYLLCGGKKKKK